MTVADLKSAEIERIFAITEDLKTKYSKGLREPLLPGRVMALLFEKPSLRTRVSFEAGMINWAATACSWATTSALGLARAIADFARVLSQYVDVVVVRAYQPRDGASSWPSYCSCSVINGLTDYAHPCQALADLYTLKELVGRLRARRWPSSATATTWPAAWPMGCGKMGMRFVMATPKGYQFDDEFLAHARNARCPSSRSDRHDRPARSGQRGRGRLHRRVDQHGPGGRSQRSGARISPATR